MPLISSATRFFANGQAGVRVGLQLQRRDAGVAGDVDDDAVDLGLAANASSLLASVPPPGSVRGRARPSTSR